LLQHNFPFIVEINQLLLAIRLTEKMDRKPLSGGEQAEQRNPDNQMVGFCP
jgi:hypothetical protein